jgi:hypothetical protein
MADLPRQRVSWFEFRGAVPELAAAGEKLLLRKRPHVGWAFIATLRRDGAPRLHPVSVVQAQDRLYVIIPHSSPKCADLLRDGRYALQAFPPSAGEPGGEFYLAGVAERIQDPAVCQAILDETGVWVETGDVLFELTLERAMLTYLVAEGTPDERPIHLIWPAPRSAGIFGNSSDSSRPPAAKSPCAD